MDLKFYVNHKTRICRALHGSTQNPDHLANIAEAEQKRVDQIKRHAVELLEVLIAAEAKLVIAEQHLDLGEDDSISFEPEILAARAVIARAKGVDA